MPTGVSKASGGGQRKTRRPAQYWLPLNEWWRSYLAEKGRRPVTTEVQVWYAEHADAVWGGGKPSWKEARIHAKCLRSTEQVKTYFRQYRARNKGIPYVPDDVPAKTVRGQRGRGASSSAAPADSEDTDTPEEGGSVPSSSDYAVEQFGGDRPSAGGAGQTSAPMPPTQPMPGAEPVQLATLNPATITTGNGVPTAWQQRSATERFGAAARPLPSDSKASADTLPAWDHAHTSIVFRPPTLSLRTKPLSPFVLSQVKQEPPGPDTAGAGLEQQPQQLLQQQQQQQQAAGGAAAAVGASAQLAPGSPVLSVAGKAQSFSCSTKRRHTVEASYGLPHAGSPSMLRQAASFTQGHPAQHVRYAAFTPRSIGGYGVPALDEGAMAAGHCTLQPQLPPPGGCYSDAGGLLPSGPAPQSNPQTVRYAPRMSDEALTSARLRSQHSWDALRHSPPLEASHAHHVDPPAEPDVTPSALIAGVDRRLVDQLARDAAARSSYLERTGATFGPGAGAVPSPRRHRQPHSSAGARPGVPMAGKGRYGGDEQLSLPPFPMQVGYDSEVPDWWPLPEMDEPPALTGQEGEQVVTPSGIRWSHPHLASGYRLHAAASDPGAPPARSLSFPIAPSHAPYMAHAGGPGGPGRRALQGGAPPPASMSRMHRAQLPPAGPSAQSYYEAAMQHRQQQMSGASARPVPPQQHNYGGSAYGMPAPTAGYPGSTEAAASDPWHSMHYAQHPDQHLPAGSGSGARGHQQQVQQGQEGRQGLPTSDSVGLPFQALRVHSSALDPAGEGVGDAAGAQGLDSQQQQQLHQHHQQQQQQQEQHWSHVAGGDASHHRQMSWGSQGDMDWDTRGMGPLVAADGL